MKSNYISIEEEFLKVKPLLQETIDEMGLTSLRVDKYQLDDTIPIQAGVYLTRGGMVVKISNLFDTRDTSVLRPGFYIKNPKKYSEAQIILEELDRCGDFVSRVELKTNLVEVMGYLCSNWRFSEVTRMTTVCGRETDSELWYSSGSYEGEDVITNRLKEYNLIMRHDKDIIKRMSKEEYPEYYL